MLTGHLSSFTIDRFHCTSNQNNLTNYNGLFLVDKPLIQRPCSLSVGDFTVYLSCITTGYEGSGSCKLLIQWHCIIYFFSCECLCKLWTMIPVATATLRESNPGGSFLLAPTVSMASHCSSTSRCKPHPSFPEEEKDGHFELLFLRILPAVTLYQPRARSINPLPT